MIAVNKELFPHAQRYIPENWLDFRGALKMKRENHLPLDQVKRMAKTHHIVKDTFTDCLQFLNDIGEILW